MTLDNNKNVNLDIQLTPLDESIRKALNESPPQLPRRKRAPAEKNTVRSVQRLPNPSHKPTEWVAKAYPKWVSSTLKYFITASNQDEKLIFRLFGISLLELKFIPDRSDENRQLFFIVGGALAKRTDYGWLEFRSVLNNDYVIAAIHEFVPKLPWTVYKSTQAIFHLWVMKAFGRFLSRIPDGDHAY
jgi:hypothetical protein